MDKEPPIYSAAGSPEDNSRDGAGPPNSNPPSHTGFSLPLNAQFTFHTPFPDTPAHNNNNTVSLFVVLVF